MASPRPSHCPGPPRLCGFDSPGQPGAGGPRAHASGGAEAEPLSQTRQHAHAALPGPPLARNERAMRLRHVPLIGGPGAWSPGAAMGRPVGAQLAPAPPAARRPAGRGPAGHGGGHRAGMAGGRQHRRGWPWRQWLVRRSCLVTQGPERRVYQSAKQWRLLAALTSGRAERRGLRVLRPAGTGPRQRHSDTQPQESQDDELLVKEGWNHGRTP